MSRLSGRSSGSHVLGVAVAVALLLPLLAACGSGSGSGSGASAGAGAGGNGAETPAPTPTSTDEPPFCGLDPQGQEARTDGDMQLPATLGYVGKTLDEVTSAAKAAKLEVRVVGEDGACHPVTDDFRTDRLNVYVENGKVVAVGAF